MNDEIAWTITKNRKMLGDDVFYVYKTKKWQKVIHIQMKGSSR